MKTTKKDQESEDLQCCSSGNISSLILYNDDIHSFDYVSDALVKVCKHQEHQALQCTYLVHYKGSCEVKRGTHEDLTNYREALLTFGLKVGIE